MRSRKLRPLKFVLALSILANLALAGYWLWPKIQNLKASGWSFGGGKASTDKGSERSGGTSSAGTPHAIPPAVSGDRTSVRVRLQPHEYAYSFRIRNLEAKNPVADGPDEPSAERSAGDLPQGAWRELAAVTAPSDSPYLRITHRVLSTDDAVATSNPELRTGCLRVLFNLEQGSGSSERTVVTPVSGSYHDSYRAAGRQWEGDRLTLWSYRTADGHGGQYAYEVYLQRKPRQ